MQAAREGRVTAFILRASRLRRLDYNLSRVLMSDTMTRLINLLCTRLFAFNQSSDLRTRVAAILGGKNRIM